MGRAPCCDKANVKRGPWSPEEDAKLKAYIEEFGTGGNWIALPQKIALRRCGKSCRLRWLNYLRPNIRHGGFSEEEDNIICSLYMSIGSRWSIIAGQLPGRTDNDIKNYWNTKLKKKLLGKQRKDHHQNKPRSSSTSSKRKETNVGAGDHHDEAAFHLYNIVGVPHDQQQMALFPAAVTVPQLNQEHERHSSSDLQNLLCLEGKLLGHEYSTGIGFANPYINITSYPQYDMITSYADHQVQVQVQEQACKSGFAMGAGGASSSTSCSMEPISYPTHDHDHYASMNMPYLFSDHLELAVDHHPQMDMLNNCRSSTLTTSPESSASASWSDHMSMATAIYPPMEISMDYYNYNHNHNHSHSNMIPQGQACIFQESTHFRMQQQQHQQTVLQQ